MTVALINSKLNPAVSLFDVQTYLTENNKSDLVMNPQGQLNRLIGIDKLAQQILKFILVKKNTYSDPVIGTDLTNNRATRSDSTLRADIMNSLSEYSKLQVSNSTFDTSIIGWNLYRTTTPNVANSWAKINNYLLSNSSYFDGNLDTGIIYYYNLVQVTSLSTQAPTFTNLGTYTAVTIPESNTENAVIGTNLIIVPHYRSASLFWLKNIYYQKEEVLSNIEKLQTWFSAGEPREFNIYLQITNLLNQLSEVSIGA